MRFAVFASGGGSNFQSILDHQQAGDLKVDFAFLLTNNSKCGAVAKAQAADIPIVHLSGKTHPSENDFSKAMLDALESQKVDMILLAGYMKKLPDAVLAKYANKVINIHPALLPSFGGQGMYGMNVHEAVVAYGAKISGITIHLVDPEYDSGPVVLQKSVSLTGSESAEEVQQKVLALEHEWYWQVVKEYSLQKVTQEGRRILCNI